MMPSLEAERLESPDGSRHRLLGVGAVAVALSVAYLIFVVHYSVNMPYEDDWTVVPLIHSAIHGHLSFSDLWTLHDENRMLVPNAIFVALGVATHDDLIALTALSAVLFIATYFLFLLIFSSYIRRPLTPASVLLVGVLWFSVAGWNNALWGFQLAWYLILFFLMAMMALLVFRRPRSLAFPMAIVAAVLASWSFLHGLVLWPVGFICLVWSLPIDPRQWTRRSRTEVVVWVGSSLVTAATSLWGYKFGTLGCNVAGKVSFNCSGSVSSYAQGHPARVGEFVLVSLGEVIPNSHAGTLWLNGLLGALLLIAAGFVIFRSIQHRHDGRNCLPVALLTFGLLDDLLIASGRAQFLTELAPSSVYTMPNLVILIALVSYLWSAVLTSVDWKHSFRNRLILTSVVGFVAVQVVISTNAGIHGARYFDRHLTTGARLVVNLDRIPARSIGCYEFYGEFVYLVFSPAVTTYPAFEEARQDKLTVFSPALYRQYRAEGLPDISQCQAS
jgi:hypothetical protein